MSYSSTPNFALPKIVDVVVIGAGLSGLRAALRIQETGFSCVVVEATDRVGGKTLTLQSEKARPDFNDLGAAWINDTSQLEMYRLVQRYGLPTVVQMNRGLDVHRHGDEAVISPHGVPPVWLLQLLVSSHLVHVTDLGVF
jgi:monoamine oxidase